MDKPPADADRLPVSGRPVVIVTGATSGIGAATACALAADHRVVLVARHGEELAALAMKLGGGALALAIDLADSAAPAALVARTLAATGRIDGLVNNAGVFEVRSAAELTAAHAERQWRVNLLAPQLLVQAALPELRRRRGTIVNVSSVAAEVAFPGCGAYAASKAGLEGWSRCLREELRGDGVRVTVVAPGATDTAIWPKDSPFDRARMCRAEDVAAVIRLALTLPATASIDRVVVAPPGGPL